MAINVCFLVAEHPFLDARIFKKEAKSLLKRGYQVTMIVPRINGCLFDVDGTLFRDSYREASFIFEGIRILTYEQSRSERNHKKLLHNLRSDSHTRFDNPLTQLGIQQKADIYHAHEFDSLYSGIGIKRALAAAGKQSKLIYDSHELEADPLEKASVRTKKVKQQMLEAMLHETDYIITVSESIKEWLHAIDSQTPIQIICNSPPLAREYRSGQGNNQELVIAFEGVMNHKRGSFRKLLEVLELCNQEFELKLKIIGGSKKSEIALSIPDHLKDKVIHTGWVDYGSISEAMKDADIGWIDLDAEHSLNNRFAMPNKFFSYLNNAVPVLTNQCKDMDDFIRTYQCGYVVRKLQATAEDYVKAIRFLHSNRGEIRKMSRHARQVMESKYCWEHMETRLFAIYQYLLNA
ncbi:glycosyltransferase [Oceanobacillus massiliensis]|uniref:glycosyltransferase n=1 Tax=Oceanobacillus massiliensis TaxID=1465765 RepID=UPI000287BB68|nr:glycosyltransferase [Oceanobacillus massiliensis]